MEKIMKILLLICFASALGSSTEPSRPCRLRKFDAGYVCVCTNDYCDTLNLPEWSDANEWMLVTSTESGQRFNFSFGNFKRQHGNSATISNETHCEINQNVLHHEVLGFGGSITGAVSYLLSKLSANLRECIYKSYYTNDDGMGYTLMRMPIGGCDFDLVPWTYNETPENDAHLSNFTELHSKDVLRINLIKQLMNVSRNFDIKIVGVTWSPPRWMKQKGEWPGKNDNRLKTEYYQTWADYHLKWLDVMQNAGIPIWAISTGNEPNFAHFTPFMGLNWRPRDQAKWISQHLGPTLKNSKHAAVQIHTFDDNRDTLLAWLNEMNTSTDALSYVSAIGVHGYFDKETSPTILDETKAKFPDKSILQSEMCFGVTGPLSTTGPILGSWTHFEELTNMLFETLTHNVNGFLDWNIMLNMHGGPNYMNNVVDAMIIVNDEFTEIYKQPLFYAAAHFTKFILPGSRRIQAIISGDNVGDLSSLAFLRPDHKVAAIFYNKHEQNTIFLRINDKRKGTFDIQIEPKSLYTLIYLI
ncbi:lysosomal acid glucosylceramidase-like [Sitodiplosis mosellana]|uniref:lysosomal acid glucosylceramidase-like n=1 Tax=Sitodiplosis mosellana TaxID=263140 RepID=UPI0024440D6F|nr:lysosomal acid glucosylceramidase-like [Sitodiplosis mosellana]